MKGVLDYYYGDFGVILKMNSLNLKWNFKNKQ